MTESQLARALAVGAGGFAGSIARYWLSGAVQRLSGPQFPYGTLAVNVLGSFVLGLVLVLSLERGVLSPSLRLFLTIGVCGGFTTMSTFGYETWALLAEGSVAGAAANVLVTVTLCVAGVWLGTAVGRIL